MAEQKDSGGPAFPFQKYEGNYETGMQLRDYFAAKAMQALMAGNFPGCKDAADYAKGAYGVADAMLKARQS